MREIKFRAWDSEYSQMIYKFDDGYHVDMQDGNLVVGFYDPNSGDYYELDLMQFTGLLDKNGKEIYEGDIVEFGGLGIVKYDEDRYYVDCGTVHTRVSKLHEVVGNIHEDSKLLIN